MPSDIVKRNFAGGEISPQLYTDASLYEGAVAEATNFVVDQKGGMSNREGTEFLAAFGVTEYTIIDTFSFQYGADTASSFLIFLIHDLVNARIFFLFMQDGAWIVDGGVSPITPLTMTAAMPPVASSVGHGFMDGDLAIIGPGAPSMLTGLLVRINSLTANTFSFEWTGGGELSTGVAPAYSGQTFTKIYMLEVTGTSVAASLLNADTIGVSQNKATLTLTTLGRPIAELTYVAAGTWTVDEPDFAPAISRPGTPTLTPSSAGTAGVAFCITAVDKFGNESAASPYAFNVLSVDYASSAGSMKVSWSKVSGAVYYNVYRTQIFPIGADISRAAPVGFVGRAYGLTFTDRNIIPDFTVTPPNYRVPFDPGGVTFIEVTAGGAGYTRASVVSITSATGSGFVGYAVVDSGGVLQGIVIENPGRDYDAADTVNVSVGAGATFTITVNGDDEFPAVSGTFQQRRVYGSTPALPLSLELSRPGKPHDFSVSLIPQSDDALQFTLEADKVAPFRHMIETRAGLLLQNQVGMWQLSATSGVLTPTDAQADPQSYTGVSNVPPMRVGPDIFFLRGKGAGLSFLTYNDWSKVYESTDVSYMASHFFIPSIKVVCAAYSEVPYGLFYFTREDGFGFNLSFNKQRELLGWSRRETKGSYIRTMVLQENDVDAVYQLIRRAAFNIGAAHESVKGGHQSVFVERVVPRNTTRPWEFWFVDAGLQNVLFNLPTVGSPILRVEASTGTGIFLEDINALGTAFSADDVGSYIYANGGRMRIASFMTADKITVDFVDDLIYPDVRDATEETYTVLDGYILAAGETSFGGLQHLAFQTIDVVADGNYIGTKVVDAFGGFELDDPAYYVTAGLHYQSRIKLLPPKSADGQLDGKLTRAATLVANVVDSRGLKVGDDLDHLEAFRERTDEAYGEPTRLQNGSQFASPDTAFEVDAGNYIVQDYPLPATITGLVASTEVGDETQA